MPTSSPTATAPEASKLVFPFLRPLYTHATPLAYAALRAVFGIMLMTHGLPKMLRTSHGSMADPMAGAINIIENVLHLPGAAALAMFVGVLEGVGGALLLIGLGTRALAAMVTVQFLVICVALGPTWSWLDRGIEYPFLMAFLSLFFTFQGGGRYSIDHALGREL